MEKVAHSCVECEWVLFLFLDEKRTVSPRVAMDIDDRVYPRYRSHRRIAIGTARTSWIDRTRKCRKEVSRSLFRAAGLVISACPGVYRI